MLAELATQDFGRTAAPQGSYGALVAVPFAKSAELIEFALADFQPDVKTDDVWYASMGAGQAVADPLLGFMRRVFWGDKPPSHREGVFAVTMVLKLGCEMAPAGVAEPIQIAVLGPGNKGRLSARRLADDELSEHLENVESAIKHFAEYRDLLQGFGEEPLTPPPTPSN